jgi:hypothetical protein
MACCTSPAINANSKIDAPIDHISDLSPQLSP